MIPMPNLVKNPSWKSSPSFALISVLALVSLAALTATAFLASARLERQASSSIGKTTLVEMALDSGKYCACQIINDYSQTDFGNTHIVTYWRTNRNDELGYPFIAKVKTSGNNYGQTSAAWYYTPLFSPAGVTRLDTNNIQDAMRFTNSHQGTFSNDMRVYMIKATNLFSGTPGLTNPICVQIPLLGGRTSPPVGWVYIDHEKRILGTTNTTTSPAVRIAWFTEDLEGLIDAEQMGASPNRSTGTNSEEISVSSAKDTNGVPLISRISSFTNSTNRKAFLSYGLLASPSISGLANSTNARYFASGLRSWRPTNPALPTNGAVEWIPAGIPVRLTNGYVFGYSNQGYTKVSLNSMATNPNALNNIATVITNNLPDFTNRAGGMNGEAYVKALAANIIDYADTDSIATSTSANGVNIVGFDNYPMLTHVFDQFLYNKGTRSITITTYLQFWNPSSISTPEFSSGTFTYRLNDTILYTNSSGEIKNASISTSALPVSNFTFPNGTTTSHFFLPNTGFITSITNSITLADTIPDFPNPGPNTIQLNNDSAGAPLTARNAYTLIISGTTNIPAIQINRYNHNLFSGTPTNIGTILGLRIASSGAPPWRTADPRMTTYLGAGSGSAYDECAYTNTYFQGYPAQDLQSGTLYANPMNWPDGYNTANNPTPNRGQKDPTALAGNPPLGPFTILDSLTLIADPAPCKISNVGSYTNICELGNIFDPIQWAPPSGSPMTNYANCNINTNTGSVWTANTLYGGGSTLRIGRPEHSLFAFTNMGGNPVPRMGMSAAALLDLFCITNLTNASVAGPYTLGAGRINLNTAPAPVLAALAGGITLTSDLNKGGAEVSATMINAFTNGVMKFRQVYPFLSPSQLAFISRNYGDSSWTNNWFENAVFSTSVLGGLNGVSSINDQGLEEWFSKIYHLSSCQSQNYRIYVVAQLVSTNSSGRTNAIGPMVKKYYQVYFQNGSAISSPSKWVGTNATYGTSNNTYTWIPTGATIDILESPY
jgi:hypothetical protein